VAVIGAGAAEPETLQQAMSLGRGLAELGVEVVCGGMGGVMEGVCRGAGEAGGQTIGILPGFDRDEANPWVDVAIPTGLGHARNQMVALNGDIVVAVGGAYGTLTEMGFAKIYQKPVIALNSWDIEGVRTARTVEETLNLVREALEALGAKLPRIHERVERVEGDER